MASLALPAWQPRTLTDRRHDITTMRPQTNPAGLTPAEIVSERSGIIDLVVECGGEARHLRLAAPSLPGPQWLGPTLLRAGGLLSLPHDWDREGAAPVDPTTMQTAIDALSVLLSSNSAIPQWTPTQRSGVQLEWHQNGVDLELAFEPGEPEGYVVFSDRNHPQDEWDGPLSRHIEDMRRLFRERLTS